MTDKFIGTAHWSKLHLASYNGQTRLVRKLVALGADVNAVTSRGQTPLALTCMMEPHPGTAAMLIEMGADVNLPDDQGMPPLARAAFGGYYRLVKMLLQANADPRMRDSVRARMDVLQYACMASASENEVLKVVKALLAAGADPSYVSGQTLKAVDYAQNNSFPRVVELLIRAEQEISSNKPG